MKDPREDEAGGGAGAGAGSGTDSGVMTWRRALAEIESRVGSQISARRVVEECSGRRGSEWILALEMPVSAEEWSRATEMVERLEAGEPLQHVLGRWGFRGLDLRVGPATLIPRPETEIVVDVAAAALRRAVARGVRPFVVDLGTGTGAIALAIVSEMSEELPGLSVWATDASPDALLLAKRNWAQLPADEASRISFLRGSWFDALPVALRGAFALVVSNPPYLAEAELGEIDDVVSSWEPCSALVAGPRGTEALEEILTGAGTWLADGGELVLELAPHQASSMCEFARRSGLLDVSVSDDLSGRARVLTAHT